MGLKELDPDMEVEYLESILTKYSYSSEDLSQNVSGKEAHEYHSRSSALISLMASPRAEVGGVAPGPRVVGAEKELEFIYWIPSPVLNGLFTSRHMTPGHTVRAPT